MAWRLYRSAISARLVYLREIGRTAFWEFCNTICHKATSRLNSHDRRGRNVRLVRSANSGQALVRFRAGAANGTKIFYAADRRWRDRPLKGRRNYEGRKALRHAGLT